MPFVGIGVGIGRQRFGGGIFAAYAARVAADGGVTEAGACVDAVSGISLDASLLLVPSGYKEDVVYSQIPTDGSGDLTFTRASTATRVNSDGLIEVAQIIGNELITNGDFSSGSTNWVLGTGWTVSANKAIGTNVPNLSRLQNNTTPSVIGQKYKYSFNASNISGAYSVYIYGVYVVVSVNTEGVISGYVTATSTNGSFWIAGATAGGLVSGIFDDITLKKVIENDLPRLDYSQGSCPALLLEPQRTNSFTQSESFADYYVNRATATDLGTPSIFSSGSIARFTANNADARFGKIIGSVTSGITYSVSGFFDLSEGIYAGISDSSGNYRIFNLLTASIVGSGGGTLTISCKSIQIGSSNYYRIAFTFTATTTGNHFFVIGRSDGTNNTTNETVAAGYFQREDSAASATSYIPTLGTSVTRVQDSCYKTGISSLIGQSEGTLFAEVNWVVKPENGSPVIGIVTLNNNVANINNCIILGIERQSGGNNRVYCLVQNSGATVAALFGSNITNGRYKIALAYKNNDFALYVNGVQIATDTSGTPPTTSEVLLGQRFQGDSFSMSDSINQALLFKTRLSNTELAQLTTI